MTRTPPTNTEAEGLAKGRVRQALYDGLCWFGTLPEPQGDVPERYHRWDDLGEFADRILAALSSPPEVAEQIADTPGAGMISEEDGLRELGLLYNYAEDDSRQFTRWNMLVAMQHGFGLASERAAPISDSPPEVEVTDEMVERALEAFDGGMVTVPSETNPRGYITFYRPKSAMRAALTAMKGAAHD